MTIRVAVTALTAVVLLTACAMVPQGTYYAPPTNPSTARMAKRPTGR